MEEKQLLSDADIERELARLEGWSREGMDLKKTFCFSNYRDITGFLQHLVQTIVDQNHHPDFSLINAKRCIPVSVSTHSAGAISRADINFAHRLNAWTPKS